MVEAEHWTKQLNLIFATASATVGSLGHGDASGGCNQEKRKYAELGRPENLSGGSIFTKHSESLHRMKIRSKL